jgi:hypothetical protein
MIRMKAILAQAPDMTAFNKVIQDQVDKYAPFAIKAADQVTSGWSGERPKWTTNKKGTNQYMYVLNLVLANPESKGAKKWTWLDEGTGPHDIVAKNAPRLVFNARFSPGSRPGLLRTYRSSSGPPKVFAVAVRHPGIKPRGWGVLLQQQLAREFEDWMRPVVINAVKASGHAL